MFRRPSHPSPALIVAVVALVVALTGTAAAASVLITKSSQIRNGVVTGKKLKKGTITADRLAKNVLVRSAQGERGPQGEQGAPGLQGPAGPKGDAGAVGAPGTARAYADFRPDLADPDKLVAARSKGVTGYTHPATGQWCFTLGTPVPEDANGDRTLVSLVSVDDANTPAADPRALVNNTSASGCPQGTIKVTTYDGTTPDDTVAFAMIVP